MVAKPLNGTHRLNATVCCKGEYSFTTLVSICKVSQLLEFFRSCPLLDDFGVGALLVSASPARLGLAGSQGSYDKRSAICFACISDLQLLHVVECKKGF